MMIYMGVKLADWETELMEEVCKFPVNVREPLFIGHEFDEEKTIE